MVMDRIALVIAILGTLNLGSIGIFKYDIIAHAFNGSATTGARVVYTIIALAGLWCISLLFREREILHSHGHSDVH